LLLLLVFERRKEKTTRCHLHRKGEEKEGETPEKKMQKMQNNRRASITTLCMVCPIRPAVVAALQNATAS